MSCEYKLPLSEAQRKLAPGLRWPTCELLFKDLGVCAVPRCVNPDGKKPCIVDLL